MSKFLKKFWLEIIAVLPFFFVFRAFEGLARILGIVEETAKEGQQALHAGVELSKEFSKGGKEIESVVKLTRGERFLRFLRPLSRSPRLFKVKGEVKEIEKERKDILKFFDGPETEKDVIHFKTSNIEFKPVKIKKALFGS